VVGGVAQCGVGGGVARRRGAVGGARRGVGARGGVGLARRGVGGAVGDGLTRRHARAAGRSLLVAAILALALAAPADAQSGVSGAADALRDDPVFVDPGAELAGQVDAAALRARIEARGAAPMFVAVLPQSATEQSAGRTLLALRDAVGESGTYALAVGDEFRTLSSSYDAAGAGEAARAAHPDDLQATLIAFIDRTGRERAGARDAGGGGALGAILVVGFLVVVALAGGLLLLGRRRARSRDGRSEVGEIDQTDDFVRLGDGIRTLELDVTLGDAGPDAKADYDRAVEAYTRANDLNRKGQPEAANQALDEGLAAIASARERLAGRR
jgi:hypothetical protein